MNIRSIGKAVAGAGVAAALLAASVAAAGRSVTSGLPTLALALNGHSVTVAGPLQSGAVNVVSTVAAGHSELTLIRLNPGVPFAAFAQAGTAIAAHQGDLNYVAPYGSIVFDVSAEKGTARAQTTLQAGNYIAVDLSSRSPNPPHAAFTITQAAHPAALSTPDATIHAIDFGFRGPHTLHDGELVRFANAGFLVHQIQGIGVKNAKAAKHLTALLVAGNDNEAQKVGISVPEFAGPLSPGGAQQELVTEPPGVYLLVCIMRTQDGREHTQLGMERTIKIIR